MLRPELLAVAEGLAARPGDVLSLDAVAEAIGTLKVSSDEIDEVLTWLEDHGRIVGESSGPSASALLVEVITIARDLRRELGRAPKEGEIVERSKLSPESVRIALRFARTLQ